MHQEIEVKKTKLYENNKSLNLILESMQIMCGMENLAYLLF